MSKITVDSPIGFILRSNPYSKMSNFQLLEYGVNIEKETGFINPSLLREIESRKIYSVFQKMLNPHMSGVVSLVGSSF